jgi:3-hydroxybutyryl-CoA dehydrogenase
MKELSQIERITVLGAGTMGHGIAQVAAQAGFEVVLRDLTAEQVSRGLARIGENLAQGVARGKVTADARAATLARLSGETSLEAAGARADVVIEAVFEDLTLKRDTFAALERSCPAHALFATNTSSLRISSIAEALANPARLVGMHFFNPVHVMKLVEVVVAPATAPAAAELARALGERFGKDPIVVKDVPGFASSRLGIAIGLEAMRMVEEGVASAEDIDKAMTLGYGHPMGPLELTDLVGLDVRLAIARYLAGELGPRYAPPAVLERLVAEGKLGKKSGHGFYAWVDGKKAP